MGDRTAFQCTIDACPEDQREAVREILDEYADHLDWTDALPAELSLDRQYTAHEVSLGTAQEITGRLTKAAPGAAFLLWEDPAYQWLGDVYAHTPELGTFTAACDADGNPVYTREQIAAMVKEITETTLCMTSATLAIELDKRMGGPWFTGPDQHTQPGQPKPDDIACGQADETGS